MMECIDKYFPAGTKHTVPEGGLFIWAELPKGYDTTELLKKKYKNSYKCVLKIEDYIRNNFHHGLSTDEKLYLMVHIERTVYNPQND